jgi:hypothetical protein
VTARALVQIPAYRDRQLLATIRDLFERARHPERLRVLVAWQYSEDARHLEGVLRQWRQLELLEIPAAESEGCN